MYEDGILDGCNNKCPIDVTKMEADTGGHGVVDDDMDKDGVLDCNDRCKEDATKT